jgi:hypothetical protein
LVLGVNDFTQQVRKCAEYISVAPADTPGKNALQLLHRRSLAGPAQSLQDDHIRSAGRQVADNFVSDGVRRFTDDVDLTGRVDSDVGREDSFTDSDVDPDRKLRLILAVTLDDTFSFGLTQRSKMCVTPQKRHNGIAGAIVLSLENGCADGHSLNATEERENNCQLQNGEAVQFETSFSSRPHSTPKQHQSE